MAAVPGPQPSRLFYVTDKSNRLQFLVDTGAEVSVIPVGKQKRSLTPSSLVLQAANSSDIRTYGHKTLSLDLSLRRKFPWMFVVADVKQPIIGIDFLTKFGLTVDLHRRKLYDSASTLSVSGCPAAIYSVQLRLPLDWSNQYQRLLADFPSLCDASTPILACKHDVRHHIIARGPAVHARPRRLAPDILVITKREFDTML